MFKHFWLLPLLGCGSADTARPSAFTTGIVTLPPGTANVSVRVAHGVAWAIAGDDAVVDERFQVPATANAVTAYVDANGDQKFDRFAEPSTFCRRGNGAWQCDVPTRKLTIYRQISARDTSSSETSYVLWEDYEASGKALQGSKLCAGGRCTFEQASPFLSETQASVQALTVCGSEGFAPLQAKVEGAEAATYVLTNPPELAVVTEYSLDSRTPSVTVRGKVDRIVAWTGISTRSAEIEKIFWTSEQSNAVTPGAGSYVITPPQEAISHCRSTPECVFTVQLLRIWNHDEAPVMVTELRKATTLGAGAVP